MKRRGAARRVAFLGLMLALALALSFVESVLPVLPGLPPGIKLGLSNIVTMYCLFFMGGKDAASVALLKSLFVLLTRGPVAAAMSLSGGLLSVGLMLLLKKCLPSLSGRLVSIGGAVAHNVGQLLMAGLVLRSSFTLYYLPVMLLSGIGMGLLTGILLRFAAPYLQNADRAFK